MFLRIVEHAMEPEYFAEPEIEREMEPCAMIRQVSTHDTRRLAYV